MAVSSSWLTGEPERRAHRARDGRRQRVRLASLAGAIFIASIVHARRAVALEGDQFVRYANEHRAANGVTPALTLSAIAEQAADERALSMAATDVFAHDFEPLSRRLELSGYCWSRYAEIILWEEGYPDVSIARFMRLWMNSYGHRAIILTPDYDRAGGSWARSVANDGKVYGVMYFIDSCATSSGDATRPAVTAQSPAAGAAGVPRTTAVTATFSEAVKAVSVSTFTLQSKATASIVSAAVGYDATARKAVLRPSTVLAAGQSYIARLSGSITDAAGNALAATSWTFTTTTSSDATRPGVKAHSPAAGAVGVPRTTAVTATFTERVKGVSTSSFVLRVKATGAVVSATVSYDATARKAVLRPASALGAGQSYIARLSSAISDAAGNALSATTWSFTTSP